MTLKTWRILAGALVVGICGLVVWADEGGGPQGAAGRLKRLALRPPVEPKCPRTDCPKPAPAEPTETLPLAIELVGKKDDPTPNLPPMPPPPPTPPAVVATSEPVPPPPPPVPMPPTVPSSPVADPPPMPPKVVEKIELSKPPMPTAVPPSAPPPPPPAIIAPEPPPPPPVAATTPKPAAVQPASLTKPAASSPYKLSVYTSNGQSRFYIRDGQDLLLKVVCDKLDLQAAGDSSSALAHIQAAGHVKVTGPGLEGICEMIVINLHSGDVVLKGQVQLISHKGKTHTELAADQVKVSLKGGAAGGMRISSSAPQQ